MDLEKREEKEEEEKEGGEEEEEDMKLEYSKIQSEPALHFH